MRYRAKKLSELWWSFFKVGLFTFGGGYAMIAIISSTCVDQKHWLTQEEMMDLTVMAESTPGPIAINAATYVGYKQAGMPGAISATLGIILPSFLIIGALSLFLDTWLHMPLLAKAFKGIKIAAAVLILDAALTMLGKMRQNTFARAVMLGSFGIMLLVNAFTLRISSITLMLLAAAAGLAVFYVREAHPKEEKNP